jgi:hypothetical protein
MASLFLCFALFSPLSISVVSYTSNWRVSSVKSTHLTLLEAAKEADIGLTRARESIKNGIKAFTQGNVEQSLVLFDEAVELGFHHMFFQRAMAL